jgi:hypothetical protein
MKAKKQILENRYILTSSSGKEIVFNKETPKKTALKIIELYENKKRVVFDYGDIKTGISWNQCYDIIGTIGMSKGFYDLRYPILVHNVRSFGGGAILTNCILSIKESKGKRLIFKS